uniref:Nucleolar protein 58-like n=1 Tax=Tanacetum cinerariifolium TaxID=118510 RepID=A0A6L2K2D0_TANCI|nr:nucleolar protein 58-like [Tanacetum cinerariifolium]
MLTEAIKQLESYQMFIKYSTSQIPPRRAEKVTLFSDDNIISDDPDTSFMLESVPEPTKRRKSRKVTSDLPKKLKGVPSLTLEEQEAVDIMQALKESKRPARYIQYKIRVCKDEDEEMLNAEVDDSDKGEEEVTNAAKAYAEKTSEVKDDAKKTERPPTRSSLSVSSVKILSKVPHNQSPSMLSVPVFMIFKPIVLTPVQESPSISTLRVAKLEKDVSKLKTIVLSPEALAALKTQVPSVVDNYLGSKVGDHDDDEDDDDEDPPARPNQENISFMKQDSDLCTSFTKSGSASESSTTDRILSIMVQMAFSSSNASSLDKSMWSDQEKKIQKIDRLARPLLIQGLPNDIYSLIDSNKTAKDLWDALARHMLDSEYGEQDRKAVKCGYSKDNYELNFKFLNNLQPEWKQYATMMRQNKNLIDIDIDALYNILKQNQGDVNDAMGLKKKTVVVTSDPLALIAEKKKVRKSKENVVVSLDSKGSDADGFSELKNITALLAKAFNRRKFYSKLTNNNLRTSSTSQSANKKQDFVKTDDKKVEKKDDEKKQDMSKVKCYDCKKEGHFAKDCKKVKVKDYEYYKTKMLLAKKDKDEKVLLAEDQAWMESSSDSDQEINANMVFMAQIEKVVSDSKASSSSADDKISERIEKANQQNKDFKNQNKDLQDKYDVLKNQATTFEMNNKELNEQLKVLMEKNDDLLAQMNVLRDQVQVKHVVIDTHVEYQEKYAKLEAERYEYMIRYSAYFDKDKKHRKQIANQEVLYDKISVQLVELDKHQTSSLKPYVPTVILEKIIIDLEDEVVSLLKKGKDNLKIIESLKSNDVETGVQSSENFVSETENKSENDCQEIEKVFDEEELNDK